MSKACELACAGQGGSPPRDALSAMCSGWEPSSLSFGFRALSLRAQVFGGFRVYTNCSYRVPVHSFCARIQSLPCAVCVYLAWWF